MEDETNKKTHSLDTCRQHSCSEILNLLDASDSQNQVYMYKHVHCEISEWLLS